MDTFGSWTYLVRVKGRSRLLALFIGMLYNDPHLARDAWDVEHEERSRKALCAVLRDDAETIVELRFGVRSSQALEVLIQRATSLRIHYTLAPRAAIRGTAS